MFSKAFDIGHSLLGVRGVQKNYQYQWTIYGHSCGGRSRQMRGVVRRGLLSKRLARDWGYEAASLLSPFLSLGTDLRVGDKSAHLFGGCPFVSFGQAKEKMLPRWSHRYWARHWANVSIHFVASLFARPKRDKKAAHQIKAHFYRRPHESVPRDAGISSNLTGHTLSPWLNASIQAPAHRRAFDGITRAQLRLTKA